MTLVAAEGAWTAERAIDRSALYRIGLLDGETASTGKPRHHLEVIADQPPSIRVVAPPQNVTMHETGQSQWPLQFEASDDFGLGAAHLRVTLAQGTGENISVTDASCSSRSRSTAPRRYSQRLDLAALGFAAGDDLIVRLAVADNRMPAPQHHAQREFHPALAAGGRSRSHAASRAWCKRCRRISAASARSSSTARRCRGISAASWRPRRIRQALRRDRRGPAHPAPALRAIPRRGIRAGQRRRRRPGRRKVDRRRVDR